MKTNPLISIIVPVYNKEHYLQECINSLTNQTYSNLEIILVDDGSKDNSPIICDNASEKDNRVRVIHKINGGLVDAWKCGSLAATGDYLSFVDADDYVDAEMILDMAEQIEDDCTVGQVVASDYIIERDSGKNTLCYQDLNPGVYDRTAIINDVIPFILGNEHRIIHFSRCMKLISKQLIIQNMDYVDNSLTMGEDMAIIFPALIDAERICIMDHKAYYHYRLIGSSMAHKYDTKAISNNKLLFATLQNIVNDKFAFDEKKREMMNDALNREEIFLLLYLVKNVAGETLSSCLNNLKQVKGDEMIGPILDGTGVCIKTPKNKLLYNTLVNPNIITVSLLKIAFFIYYR